MRGLGRVGAAQQSLWKYFDRRCNDEPAGIPLELEMNFCRVPVRPESDLSCVIVASANFCRFARWTSSPVPIAVAALSSASSRRDRREHLEIVERPGVSHRDPLSNPR